MFHNSLDVGGVGYCGIEFIFILSRAIASVFSFFAEFCPALILHIYFPGDLFSRQAILVKVRVAEPAGIEVCPSLSMSRVYFTQMREVIDCMGVSVPIVCEVFTL